MVYMYWPLLNEMGLFLCGELSCFSCLSLFCAIVFFKTKKKIFCLSFHFEIIHLLVDNVLVKLFSYWRKIFVFQESLSVVYTTYCPAQYTIYEPVIRLKGQMKTQLSQISWVIVPQEFYFPMGRISNTQNYLFSSLIVILSANWKLGLVVSRTLICDGKTCTYHKLFHCSTRM